MPSKTMPSAKDWAKVVRDGSTDGGVVSVILAINEETRSKRANQADVMVACAQILGQSIAPGGPDIASELRQAVMSMIDGYTYQVAAETTP
jgi:cytochrome c-type biogenesis protein CcmH/NrfF